MNYIKKLMEDNNIEVNEEFYITDNNCILVALEGTRFFFNEKSQLKEKVDDSICNNYIQLKGLMSGEYRIEKIPQKPKTVWDLTEEDMYYYIDMCGNVGRTTFRNSTRFADEEIIKIGNAFLTKEEAKFEVERRKCEAVLLKYGTRDLMSFGDINAHKYFIVYNNYYHEISISFYQSTNSQGTIYFESVELAEKAVEEVGQDRLKKYIFNVKE